MKEKMGLILIAVAISLSGMENPLIAIATMAAGLWLIKGVIEWE